MSLRLEEIFDIIAHELEKANLSDYLRAGVFICGGGSRVKGLEKLAERVFQMSVTPGHSTTLGGITAALDQPEFATSIGLVKYGSLKNRQRPTRPGFSSGIRTAVGKFFQRA
jgi:cell division protein FtsA